MMIEMQFPSVPRGELRSAMLKILSQAVQARQSQAVVLYGPGGAGKTYFLRDLAEQLDAGTFIWLGAYDVDDAEFRLLSNLETRIANRLDPNGRFFAPYFEYQAEMPASEMQRSGLETLLAYSHRGQQIFEQCYRRCLERAGKVPVLAFDTFEAIRGLDIQPRLIAWLKHLSPTVVVLASRRPAATQVGHPGFRSLTEDLDREPRLPHVELDIHRFSQAESHEYLAATDVGARLSEAERRAIIHLADGNPLWLSMAVRYLWDQELPPAWLAWERDDPAEEHVARQDFLRYLIVPYRGADFWSEAVKRLAIVRRRVSQEVWRDLLSDLSPPAGVSWTEAWRQLLALPWIRARASQEFVTLHDAVAEALAQHLIPLDDKDHVWRNRLWARATTVYQRLVVKDETHLQRARDKLRELLSTQSADDVQLMREVVNQKVRTIDHYLLVSTSFYYQMLSDRRAGLMHFIERYDSGYDSHAYRLIELLWQELQHFLVGGNTYDPLEDVIKGEVATFAGWYAGQADLRYEVEWRVAKYLIERGRPRAALTWLDPLLASNQHDHVRAYTLLRLRGNARFRIRGCAPKALEDFEAARDLAQEDSAPEWARSQLGDAHTELGYYHRNVGNWLEAERHYHTALAMTPRGNRQRLCRIQTELAHVLALSGRLDVGDALSEFALELGRGVQDPELVARTLSTRGDCLRYLQRYQEAMDAYREAEGIFLELGRRAWIGLVSQKAAILLHWAAQAKQPLREFESFAQMNAEARGLALEAVALCRDYNVRQLSPALNRAGRIVADVDLEHGLALLAEGCEVALENSDSWMLIANHVDYAALCAAAWQSQQDERYLVRIRERIPRIESAFAETQPGAFQALRGRWQIIRGHVRLADSLQLASSDTGEVALTEAIEFHERGLLNIARAYPTLRRSWRPELQTLGLLLPKLSTTRRRRWMGRLEQCWRTLADDDVGAAAILYTLLGRLDRPNE